MFFLLPTCFDHQKTDQLFNWENKQYLSFNMKQTEL
jgi:hypothetical protein